MSNRGGSSTAVQVPKFAPVVPPQALRKLCRMGYRCTYLLVLAHDVVEQSREWEKVINEGLLSGTFIILDNSLVELGKPASTAMMSQAQDIIGANVAVLPDYLGNAKKTLRHSKRAAGNWNHDECLQDIPYMGVVQGETHDEAMDCARCLLEIPNVHFLAIPRHMCITLGSRVKITQEVSQLVSNLHLLGFSDDLSDDMATAHLPGVMGIDSAVPLRLAYQSVSMVRNPLADAGRRGNFWDVAKDPNNVTPLWYHNALWMGDLLQSNDWNSLISG